MGEVIEAHREGTGAWEGAFIRAANDDGTFNIKYESDGTTEDGKKRGMIRPSAFARVTDKQARSLKIFPAFGPLKNPVAEQLRKQLALRVR